MEYYDVGLCDLREFWEPYSFEPVLSNDVMMGVKEDEWNNLLYLKDRSPLGVVLRDRLMTDAALGGPKPIKSEHSYSLLASSPPLSPATPDTNSNVPATNLSADSNAVDKTSINHPEEHHKTLQLDRDQIDDLDEECFPVISMTAAPGNEMCMMSRLPVKTEIETDDCPEIKGEPISAPNSPCVHSSSSADNKSTIITVEPQLHFPQYSIPQISDSEEEDEDAYQSMELEETYRESVESSGAPQELPPTPPSSASSDSEGTVSTSCSPERRDSQTSAHVQSLKGLLAPRMYITSGSHSTRQPIHTPLISCQPKGSTGILVLTEEEKRTLLSEGYPIPTKLPLSKHEEKSLKKIRRKIKNKISAQESRRKKKEYVDSLERRLTAVTNELASYKDRLNMMEESNCELLKELKDLRPLRMLLQKSF